MRGIHTEKGMVYVIEAGNTDDGQNVCEGCLLRMSGEMMTAGMPGVDCTGRRANGSAVLSVADRSPHKLGFLSRRLPCIGG